jgi:hypothetical protein
MPISGDSPLPDAAGFAGTGAADARAGFLAAVFREVAMAWCFLESQGELYLTDRAPADATRAALGEGPVLKVHAVQGTGHNDIPRFPFDLDAFAARLIRAGGGRSGRYRG